MSRPRIRVRRTPRKASLSGLMPWQVYRVDGDVEQALRHTTDEQHARRLAADLAAELGAVLEAPHPDRATLAHRSRDLAPWCDRPWETSWS